MTNGIHIRLIVVLLGLIALGAISAQASVAPAMCGSCVMSASADCAAMPCGTVSAGGCALKCAPSSTAFFASVTVREFSAIVGQDVARTVGSLSGRTIQPGTPPPILSV